MFTGIVQSRVELKQLEPSENGISVYFESPNFKLSVGDSVLINGICSTVTAHDASVFSVDYMEQTVRLTTVSDWRIGKIVNLEPAITMQSKFSGWIVAGHVDTIGEITAFQSGNKEARLAISFPDKYNIYLVQQGSITIDGINLTISEITTQGCAIHLIPHTIKNTTLNSATVGLPVNLEFDYFAKLTARYLTLTR